MTTVDGVTTRSKQSGASPAPVLRNQDEKTECSIITKSEVEGLVKEAVEAAVSKFSSSFTALYNKKLETMEEKIMAFQMDAEVGLSETKKDIAALKDRCSEMEATISSLRNINKNLLVDHDELEQYGRRNNLIFRGLTQLPNETYEETVVKFVNNTLSVTDTLKRRVQVTLQDIDVAHPLKTKKETDPPVIIAKFVRRSVKNAVVSARRQLAGKPVSISEDLTRKNQKLLNDLKNCETISQAWAWNGRVFGLKLNCRKADIFTLKDDLPA